MVTEPTVPVRGSLVYISETLCGGGPPSNLTPDAFTQMGTHIQMCGHIQTHVTEKVLEPRAL